MKINIYKNAILLFISIFELTLCFKSNYLQGKDFAEAKNVSKMLIRCIHNYFIFLGLSAKFARKN